MNTGLATSNRFVLVLGLLTSLVLGGLVLGLSSLGRRGWLVGLLFAGGYLFTSTLGRVLPEILGDNYQQDWFPTGLVECLFFTQA